MIGVDRYVPESVMEIRLTHENPLGGVEHSQGNQLIQTRGECVGAQAGRRIVYRIEPAFTPLRRSSRVKSKEKSFTIRILLTTTAPKAHGFYLLLI